MKIWGQMRGHLKLNVMSGVACQPDFLNLASDAVLSDSATHLKPRLRNFSRAAVSSVDALLGQVRYSSNGQSRFCRAAWASDVLGGWGDKEAAGKSCCFFRLRSINVESIATLGSKASVSCN